MTATVPTITTTPLPPMSDDDWWNGLTEVVADIETADEADHLEPFEAAGLATHERRALFAWLRHMPEGKGPYYGNELSKDPLLKQQLRIGGWFTDHPSNVVEYRELRGSELWDAIDPSWWPGSIDSQVTAPGRHHVWIKSQDNRCMATFTCFGPLHGLSTTTTPPPALAGGGGELAGVVEAVRAEGGRKPGRPPATATVLASLNPRKRMTVACELVENEGWRQADAARAANVTPPALSRALARRRDVRLRN